MLNPRDPIRSSATRASRREAQRGITLIETLIAVLVLGIGLLGVASMQSTGLRMSDSAQMRSQATILAQDMMERMRANPEGFADDEYDVAGGAASAGDASDYSTCFPDAAPSGGGCDPATMASADLHAWSQLLNERLPLGEGVICIDDSPQDGDAPSTGGGSNCSGTGDEWAIKVWWRDRDDQRKRFVTTFDTL